MKNTVSLYGDSFCMSRDVEDNQTIAYHLGLLSGVYCANYGVGNYGLDQAIMRLQRCYHSNPTAHVGLVVTPLTLARSLSVYRHWNEPGNILAVKPRAAIDDDGRLRLIPYPLTSKNELFFLKHKKKFLRENDGHHDHIMKNHFSCKNPDLIRQPSF